MPIYYESRLAELALSPAEKPTLDASFDEVTEGARRIHHLAGFRETFLLGLRGTAPAATALTLGVTRETRCSVYDCAIAPCSVHPVTAHRSWSMRLSHSPIWFQLTKMRLAMLAASVVTRRLHGPNRLALALMVGPIVDADSYSRRHPGIACRMPRVTVG